MSTSFSSEKSYSPSILMCAHDCGEWDLMAVIISTRAAGSDLCAELKISRATLYRYVSPAGDLREHGTKALSA